MPELSEEIRDYVDTACPPLVLDELGPWREGGTCRSVPLPRRRTVIPIALGLVLVAVVLAVAFQVVPSSPSDSNAAAATLAKVAQVAGSQPPLLIAGKDQYLFSKVTEGSVLTVPTFVGQKRPFIVRDVQTIQTWVAPNGSGRQRIVTNDSLLLASQQAAWRAAGSRGVIPPGPSDTVFPTSFSGRQPVGGPMSLGQDRQWYLSFPATSKFPTQPAALERALKHFYKVKGGPATVFSLAGTALEVDPSPSLRAATFEMVEHLPRIVLLGTTTDEAGRTGVGVAIDAFGAREVLIFNPKTSAVLGEETIATRATSYSGTIVPKGTVIEYETFGPTGVTSSIFSTPKR